MHLLRPQFTLQLLETLKKESINVHGPYGQGQTRLLKDISQLAREQGLIVLSVDMKHWAEHYDGMVSEMSRQVRAQLPVVAKPFKNLAQLVKALDTHAASTTVLVMLQHFDALLDNTVHLDGKYSDFFKHLNSLRNQENRVLLAVTAKPYSQYRFYIDKILNTSPLDLKLSELKPLSYEDIKAELQVRVNPLAEQDLALLTRTIHAHTQAFEFLDYCAEQLNNGNDHELSLAKRLKSWHKNFKRDHKKSFWWHLERLQNWLKKAGAEIVNFSLRLKVFLFAVAGLLSMLALFFNKIKQLLGLSQ
ncbi:MAG: hypothetical protein PHI13_09945 [Methylococcales bacterium]|nr:hypothetical protein [Methylococcales bacterium]